MGELRKPLFLVAVVAILLVVLVELGSSLLIGGKNVGSTLLSDAGSLGVEVPPTAGAEEPAGLGIPYLALIDGIALYTVALMGVALLLPDRIHARLQGIVTLIGSIVLIIVAIILTILAFVLLIVMVSLLLAVPFGTIAYLALFGFFPRGDAAVVLSLLMFLKLAFCVFLVLAQPRFLQNKGLVLLVLTSLLVTLMLAFLYGFVPSILVSIADAIGAVIIAVVAIIWGIILLIGSIPAVVKAVRATAP